MRMKTEPHQSQLRKILNLKHTNIARIPYSAEV